MLGALAFPGVLEAVYLNLLNYLGVPSILQ